MADDKKDQEKAAETAPQPPPGLEREELSDDDVEKVAGADCKQSEPW